MRVCHIVCLCWYPYFFIYSIYYNIVNIMYIYIVYILYSVFTVYISIVLDRLHTHILYVLIYYVQIWWSRVFLGHFFIYLFHFHQAISTRSTCLDAVAGTLWLWLHGGWGLTTTAFKLISAHPKYPPKFSAPFETELIDGQFFAIWNLVPGWVI